MPAAEQPIHYHRYSLASGWNPQDANVITELAVSLSVNGENWLSFACTPTDLDALAAGFLYNEGIIQRREEIVVVDICHQGTQVDIWLDHVVERPTEWRRTSGCTGGLTSVSAEIQPLVVASAEKLDPHMILQGMEQLLNAQDLYRETGGVHCSALSDGQTIRVRAEDIGRHNTLDKLAGRMLLDQVNIHPALILTTGRISSEMLQKSARLGAVAVISRTSPTSQSIELAEQMGITLIGYARKNQFLVYAHPERLLE